MGDSENVVTITPRDMYDVIMLMRGDLQRVVLGLDHVLADTRDHEARLRAIEAEDFVTAEHLAERSSRSLIICATVAGIVSCIIGVADFMIMHH